MSLWHRFHSTGVHARRVRSLCNHLAAIVPRDVSLLDVGCGDGLLARDLSSIRPDVRVTGIDILVRTHTHIPVTAFDGMHIPYGDNELDVLLFVDVLHHIEDPLPLLREAARVAARGIIIKDHLADRPFAASQLKVMDILANRRHGISLPCRYLTKADWDVVFSRLGLRTIHRREDLRLYHPAADWLFGKGLHFMAYLSAERGALASDGLGRLPGGD